MNERMVKIPLSIYQDLVKYFLLGNDDLNLEKEIITWLKDKQAANERRLLYSAKLAAEKNGGAPKRKIGVTKTP